MEDVFYDYNIIVTFIYPFFILVFMKYKSALIAGITALALGINSQGADLRNVLANQAAEPLILESKVNSKGLNFVDTEEERPKKFIILDPGHGGADPGAQYKGVDEDEVAYDISVRVKKLLEKKGYKVHQTVVDEYTGFNPQHRLINNQEEYLLHPDGEKLELTHKLLEKRCEVINEVYKQNIDSILVSIHINSTYPQIRGASVYYPNKKTYKSKKSEYNSKNLAEMIKNSMEIQGVPTYSIDFFGIQDLDILSKVKDSFNNGKDFKLAIFRDTKVETKILIECGNIRNSKDLEILTTPKGRQKIAGAIYKGIVSYDEQQ